MIATAIKHCIVMYSFTDAILNMVNNIAANVLGGNPEDGDQSGGNSIHTQSCTYRCLKNYVHQGILDPKAGVAADLHSSQIIV